MMHPERCITAYYSIDSITAYLPSFLLYTISFLIFEYEECVTQQIHLKNSLLNTHRLNGKSLCLNNFKFFCFFTLCISRTAD